jgi:hypothetical protein
MTFPSDQSLHGVLMADGGFADEMQQLAMKGTRYPELWKNKALKNEVIAERLYKDSSKASLVQTITECDAAPKFLKKFQESIDKVDPGELMDVLALKSFPETYFHPQIALALHASGKLTKDAKTLEERVQETGLVMFSKDSRRLATGLMVGLSHSHRRNVYVKKGQYIEETVAYTLLTFSWFGAKAAGGKQEGWYYYWRIFGSLMGLPMSRLPKNDKEASEQMKALHKSCPAADKLGKEQQALLDLYIESFKDEVLKAYTNKPENLSSRMVEYLKLKGLVDKTKKELKGK